MRDKKFLESSSKLILLMLSLDFDVFHQWPSVAKLRSRKLRIPPARQSSLASEILVKPFRRPRFNQLDGLGNRNGPRQGKQQMDVVSGAANGQCSNSTLPGDAADVGVKHFLDVLANHRPAVCGPEHHVNQATCVTVRHVFSPDSYLIRVHRTGVLGYSQPSLRDWSSSRILPSTACWATLSRPSGTGQLILGLR